MQFIVYLTTITKHYKTSQVLKNSYHRIFAGSRFVHFQFSFSTRKCHLQPHSSSKILLRPIKSMQNSVRFGADAQHGGGHGHLVLRAAGLVLSVLNVFDLVSFGAGIVRSVSLGVVCVVRSWIFPVFV